MIQSKLDALIKPTIDSLGYELWGCEYLPQGRYALLRVYIDRAQGISLEDCECVSHQISALLDVDDPIASNYSLEVSSPGVPRPLFYPAQYARYCGHELQLKLYKAVSGQRKWTGELVSATENDVTFTVGQQQVVVPFSNILKAYVTSK